MDHGAFLLATIELGELLFGKPDRARHLRMDGEISAQVRVLPRAEFRALLTNDNASCIDGFPAKQLYATALATAIPYVARGAAGLLMRHG